MKWRIGGLLLAMVLAVGAYWYSQPQWPGRLQVGDREFRVRIADEPAEQQNGLRGVKKLDPDRGMLFVFPTSNIQTFTMQGMSIALDFVWISQGKVVGITPNVPPDPWESARRHQSPEPVEWVLELAAGAAAANGVVVGQTVTR